MWPSVDLVERIIVVESGGNPMAAGAAGERGLMQIMPGTWADRGLGDWRDAHDPRLNIRVGVAHLRWTRDELTRRLGYTPSDPVVCMAYNAGVGRAMQVARGERDWPASTMQYESRVATADARALPADIRAMVRQEVGR